VRVRFPLFAKYCLALVLGVGVSLPVTAGAQTSTSKPASTQKPSTQKPATAKPTPAQTAAAQRRPGWLGASARRGRANRPG
jgi:hypothetical protein